MQAKQTCRRTRFVCTLCQQTLGYSAFQRHQNLPHLYCPGYIPSIHCTQEQSDSESSDSTFVLDVPSPASSPLHDATDDIEPETIPAIDEPLVSLVETQSSGESDSAPEVWNEIDSSSSESDSEFDASQLTAQVKCLHYVVCLFFALFQLCFRISDRALSQLLSFLHSLLRHLSFHVNSTPYFISFAKTFPTNLYSLRKYLKARPSYTKYVVCQKCHKLYNESECVLSGSGLMTSIKCQHVEFPNHPQRVHRKKCGAEQ